MNGSINREQKIRDKIKECLFSNNCLLQTDFIGLPDVKTGKVRDSYECRGLVAIITTDRQSAFDRILAAIPFKGQVLNQISAFWFEKTRFIVSNHVINIPDPNATLARKCEVLKLEMVVRGYLTGSTDTSAWTMYKNGGRNICGNIMPDGMVKNQPFERPILTPTTKSATHDGNITPEEAISMGIVSKRVWDRLAEVALNLFNFGTKIAAENGLILVDTKYEFGIDSRGKIRLIDEVHTPDSSRYWLKKTYAENLDAGKEPDNIDKEFLRLWFKNNCDPYKDEVIPEAPAELVEELSFRYIKLYEMITGKDFIFPDGNIQKRMKNNLSHLI